MWPWKKKKKEKKPIKMFCGVCNRPWAEPTYDRFCSLPWRPGCEHESKKLLRLREIEGYLMCWAEEPHAV